jgi:DNA-binding beta-propeller fold protein YncE
MKKLITIAACMFASYGVVRSEQANPVPAAAQAPAPARGAVAPDPPAAPYEEVKGWGPGVAGNFDWEPAGVDVDRSGRVYFLRRSDPPIYMMEPSGKVLKTFGTAMFVWAHGLSVDRQGNVWATDCAVGPSAGSQPQLQKLNQAAVAAGRGHQVYKFSPDGKLLMTIGKAGQPGEGPGQFHCPSDVIVAPDGSFFVSDGHEDTPNARILKFTKDGKFIKTWGTRGKEPGQFASPHALAFDSKGRLFVGDRGNRRIQIFDLDGNFLDQYTGFGSASGIAITADDTIYVTETGRHVLFVGDAKTGKVTGMIPDVWAEGVGADNEGNVYVGEVFRHVWRKFTRKK